MIQEEKDKETINSEAENQDSNKQGDNQEKAPETAEQLVDEKDAFLKEITDLKDKHLRLYSEFENFRRRTAKEKVDLVKTANEEVLASLLSVLDDFSRAQKSMEGAKEVSAVKEGVDLIYNKLFKTLEAKGLKPMNAVGKEFDTELHEAITQVPAPSEDMKGKVIDEVEKGYFLNDKVIRFAKVVIGA